MPVAESSSSPPSTPACRWRLRASRPAGPSRWPTISRPCRRPRPGTCACCASCMPARRRPMRLPCGSDCPLPNDTEDFSMRPPHIRTELPGPNARALLARDRVVSSPSYPRDYPFVMARGRGVEVWDVDGNRFLDFAAGIAVCSTGHAHPAVAQAIKSAADDFLHISPDFCHERQVALGEKINALSPMGEPVLSFFCQSGTEAVEGALKLARYVTGRSRFIGFLGGFHGRTMGSLAFTASKCTQQQGFFSTMPGVTHVPYPNRYRPLFAGDDQGQAVLDYIENVLFVSNVPPNEVAAVLIEPIQCEGGYLVPPDGFLAGLRQLCDRYGILLILDEVQSGLGRSGKFLACQHWDVQR